MKYIFVSFEFILKVLIFGLNFDQLDIIFLKIYNSYQN